MSQGGCRISNIRDGDFSAAACVRLEVPGFGALEGHVRQAGAGAIALRYVRPLHLAALDRLVSACRSEDSPLAANSR